VKEAVTAKGLYRNSLHFAAVSDAVVDYALKPRICEFETATVKLLEQFRQ
jgi:hypothetical protein